MAKFVFSGGQDLLKVLEELPGAVSHTVAIEALSEVAEPIRADAASAAPRGPGSGPHLADNIIVSETSLLPGGGGRWRSTDPHEHVIAIGPSYREADVFWGLFQEFGTVKAAARAFLRPAFDTGAPGALRGLAASLWRAIAARARGKVA